MIRTILFSFFLLINSIYLFGQVKSQGTSAGNQFEGSINLIKKTINDTTFYVYYIKGQKIRIDIKEKSVNSNSIENYLLFDLENKSIVAISPTRKLYIPLQTGKYKKAEDKNFVIIKSNNKKVVTGYECYQWRVRNAEMNTEMTYWVASENFTFFEELLKLWNRTEKHAFFYLQIPEINGFFPIESVERTLLRDEKMKLLVTGIKKNKIDESLFKIPADYKSYDQ